MTLEGDVRSRQQDTANLSVPSVSFARLTFSGAGAVTVTAGLSNKGDRAV